MSLLVLRELGLLRMASYALVSGLFSSNVRVHCLGYSWLCRNLSSFFMQKSGYFFSVLYPSTVRLDGNFFFLKYSHKSFWLKTGQF